MVILTSNSCSTLVSLDDYKKPSHDDLDSSSTPRVIVSYQKTNLLLPSDLFSDDDDFDLCCPTSEQHLYLPTSGPVDRYLQGVPQVMETADELLANAPKLLTASSPQRIISVGQAEVAHCTPHQADVIVSDKATTCHVLMLRSNCNGENILVTCAHIDSVQYESCIRAMLAQHVAHHANYFSMDIHILGGFNVEASQTISNWLLALLGQLSHEVTNMTMRLQTCAISSMNDDGHGCPIGRGLAMNVATGTVFLAKVDMTVAGPVPILRAARLWSSASKRLTVIHSSTSRHLEVQAFDYIPMPDTLLVLPDEVLLQCTSTSPHAEEPDFCDLVRSTVSFMNTVDCKSVFSGSSTLIFDRVGRSNEWQRVWSAQTLVL